jgi:hypothetical protein
MFYVCGPKDFDGQRVKVVRGPHGSMMPATARAFLDEECCVIDVSLTLDNEWEYKVEFEYGLVRELTAKYLTQAQRNDERPSDWERVQDA